MSNIMLNHIYAGYIHCCANTDYIMYSVSVNIKLEQGGLNSGLVSQTWDQDMNTEKGLPTKVLRYKKLW